MLPEEGEYLTNGWEDDLDPGDSLERQAVLGARLVGPGPDERRAWRLHRRTALVRGKRRRGVGAAQLGDRHQPTARLGHDRGRAVGGIRQGVSAIVISPFPTPDLSAQGLALVGHPPLMFRPTSTVTETPATPLQVREATTTQELQDAERVLVEGYPMPDMAGLPPGDFYRPDVVADATRLFVGYDDGVPVATAAAHSAAGVTVVENVALLAHRPRQGCGRGPDVGSDDRLAGSRRPFSLRATKASPSTSGSATCASSAGPAGCAPEAARRVCRP